MSWHEALLGLVMLFIFKELITKSHIHLTESKEPVLNQLEVYMSRTEKKNISVILQTRVLAINQSIPVFNYLQIVNLSVFPTCKLPLQ